MLAMGAIAFITVVGFGLILAVTVLVTLGTRQEERYQSLKQVRPPSLFALLARMILGLHVRKHGDEPIADARPDDVLPLV